MTLLEQLKREREACSEEFERLVRTSRIESTRALRSASDIEAHFGRTDDCIQITSGIFRGSISSVAAHDASVKVIALESSCGFQLRTEVEPARALIGFVEPEHAATRIIAHGCSMRPDDAIAVKGTDLLLTFLGPAKTLWLDIDVRRGAFSTILEAVAPRTFCAILHPASAHLTLLRAYARRALDGVMLGVGEDELRAIGEVLSAAAARSTPRLHDRRMRIFREAQNFMWSHIEEPATLEDIARASECKVRTLIYAFKFAVGLSPMRYFKLQRLNAARRKLRAHAAATSVLNIAADCGFWHMGHFGCDYKNLFGVPPSVDQMRPLRRFTRGVIA